MIDHTNLGEKAGDDRWQRRRGRQHGSFLDEPRDEMPFVFGENDSDVLTGLRRRDLSVMRFDGLDFALDDALLWVGNNRHAVSNCDAPSLNLACYHWPDAADVECTQNRHAQWKIERPWRQRQFQQCVEQRVACKPRHRIRTARDIVARDCRRWDERSWARACGAKPAGFMLHFQLGKFEGVRRIVSQVHLVQNSQHRRNTERREQHQRFLCLWCQAAGLRMLDVHHQDRRVGRSDSGDRVLDVRAMTRNVDKVESCRIVFESTIGRLNADSPFAFVKIRVRPERESQFRLVARFSVTFQTGKRFGWNLSTIMKEAAD